MLVAVRKLASSRLPINPVSTIATKGMARLAKKIGIDKCKRFLIDDLFDKINYFAVQPPSITKDEPVIIDEALEAK